MNEDIQINKQFADAGVNEFLIECFKSIGFTRPTPIQFYSIKASIDNNKSQVCQSKSGTGKTLTYLIILLQELLKIPVLQINKTYQLILLPTRQLAIQVYQNLRHLLESVNNVAMQRQKSQWRTIKSKIKSIKILLGIGGIPFDDDKKTYQQYGAHILIGTVGRIHELLSREIISTEAFNTIVLDQGDKLIENKNQYFLQILKKLEKVRLLVYSATYSQKILKYLSEHGKYIFIQTLAKNNKLKVTILGDSEEKLKENQLISQKQINLQNIHKFKMNLDFSNGTILNVKIKALVTLLSDLPFKKCLIFVQKKALIQQLSQRLTIFQPLVIHGSLSQASRIKLMNQVNQSKIIMASDLLARGIDFLLDLVILFDAKQNDMLWHRIGRTGRFGRSGAVVSLDNVSDWEQYDFNKVKQLLDVSELGEKKQWFGQYMVQLGDWVEVKPGQQLENSNNYKYFDEQAFKIQAQMIESQKITEQIGKNKILEENKQKCGVKCQQLNLVTLDDFTNHEQLLSYIERLLKCQKCRKMIEEITKLTGYQFLLKKYIEANS